MAMHRLLLALPAFIACAVAAQGTATFTVRTLTPEAALRAAQAALQACARSGYQVAVTVNDRGGTPLVMLRDRLAGLHTPETSGNKAYTALAFKQDTLSFAKATRPEGDLGGIRQLPRVVAVGGGRIIEAGGSLVGSIGVSGAPGGEADDACARAGIAAIQDDLDF